MRFGKVTTQAAFAAASLLFGYALAQYEEMVPGSFTDEETGIEFASWSVFTGAGGVGEFTMGIALPADALETDATEYIGYLSCTKPSQEETGWCGFAHAGHMTTDLLLMAWPHEGQVLTSFRYTTGYHMPSPYTGGNATLTQIRSRVNDTSYEVVFRCQGCFTWPGAGGEDESVHTSSPDRYAVFGYAQSSVGPRSPACPARLTFGFHDNGFAQWIAEYEGAVSERYDEWAALATETVTGSC
ncbi:hypothetical protein PspLS_00731 [Pyricularia sp. CBS 133598]|nr:hypothetical protein PspLS_00731 [Pyricularia sp. CBS 133598]